MGQIEIELAARLQRGPTVLFFGQTYLSIEGPIDPFLKEVTRKYGFKDSPVAGYASILDSPAASQPEASLAWMQERCRRMQPPNGLSYVAQFPWSSVFTSAIDVIWHEAFRQRWRELHLLLEEKFWPEDPRNKFRLNCVALFGSVDRTERSQRPPLSLFELGKRRQVAVALLRRLPEIVTPFGTLLIDGFSPSRDWLKADELGPVLDDLGPGQVHVFSADESFATDTYFQALASNQKVTLHGQSLAEFMRAAVSGGHLSTTPPVEVVGDGLTLRMRDKLLHLPVGLWRQVVRSATVLTSELLAVEPSMSRDARYSSFKAFLSRSSVRPDWQGLARGFAFRRTFVDELKKRVTRRIARPKMEDHPLVLHGQTGSGKTVGLGLLASDVYSEGGVPVLFVERRPQKPNRDDIDIFCRWAEEQGAPATLIVWDGMTEIDEYSTLQRYLEGRGRRIVMVGSTYKQPSEAAQNQRGLVAAPTELSPEEVSGFTEFLNALDPHLGEELLSNKRTVDSTFFVALYWLLPDTRPSIRDGVEREAQYTERQIRERAIQAINRAELSDSPLAIALVRSGVADRILQTAAATRTDHLVALQDIIGLVMVPGRFGIRVPIELLLRSTVTIPTATFVDVLRDVDLLRWDEDEAGNVSVGPRHSLEAQLLVQTRLGGAHTELQFAIRLIEALRGGPEGAAEREVDFAVELIRCMGPNSIESREFSPFFEELAKCLTRVRTQQGVTHPRLMLQEATLMREAAVFHSNNHEPYERLEPLFLEAEKTLTSALAALSDRPSANQLKSFILVELSSLLAASAHSLLRVPGRDKEALATYRRAREAILSARSLDPENYHPLDVMAWATRDVLKEGVLSLGERAELEADLLHSFTSSDVTAFNYVQQERFRSRQMEIGALLRRDSLTDEAFETLRAMGSCAGFYLRAYQLVKDVWDKSVIDDESGALCRRAREYIEGIDRMAREDRRCQYLAFKLWWLEHARHPPLQGNREVLPFARDAWQECYDRIQRTLGLSEFRVDPVLRYLIAVSSFHLERIAECWDHFSELERDAEHTLFGRRRIVRSYIAGSPDGHPEKYEGNITFVHPSRIKGEVYVPRIRRAVPFFVRDFRLREPQVAQPLGQFHIAFNFLGPIADPEAFYRYHGAESTNASSPD